MEEPRVKTIDDRGGGAGWPTQRFCPWAGRRKNSRRRGRCRPILAAARWRTPLRFPIAPDIGGQNGLVPCIYQIANRLTNEVAGNRVASQTMSGQHGPFLFDVIGFGKGAIHLKMVTPQQASSTPSYPIFLTRGQQFSEREDPAHWPVKRVMVRAMLRGVKMLTDSDCDGAHIQLNSRQWRKLMRLNCRAAIRSPFCTRIDRCWPLTSRGAGCWCRIRGGRRIGICRRQLIPPFARMTSGRVRVTLKYLQHIHRLDADTSGVRGCCSPKARGPCTRAPGEMFESRRMEKTYLAVIEGQPRQAGMDVRSAPRAGSQTVRPHAGGSIRRGKGI